VEKKMKNVYASIGELIKRRSGHSVWALALLAVILVAHPAHLFAQSLGWDGETGIFATPTAYTVSTPEHRFALPVASYHYLNAGAVLGTFSQVSITSGYAKRLEFGYTRDIHAAGNNATLSPLWSDGFNTFHAKGILIKENAWKQPWMPEVSTGFMVRSQVRNLGGALTATNTTNADVYLVGTKTITQLKPMPILISAGVRGTNAELWGLAVILGAEVAQQPRHPDQLPNAVIRTTMVYAARVVPSPKLPLNVDFGVLQGPGVVAPGIDLQAKDRPAFAISYAF
jgi:hypothetical protein